MDYLSPTYFLDFEHPVIQEMIVGFQSGDLTKIDQAVGLYYKIRDGWRYDPYQIDLIKPRWKASFAAQKDTGHCLSKSIMYVAGLRGLGIPARLHLAKVRNHIAVERLLATIGTNDLSPHGMVDVFLNGKWVKASPAFNASLCEKCQVAPLDFNGIEDSIFQQYNREGSQFMEYLEDYGHFENVPFDFMFNNLLENYPQLTAYLDQDFVSLDF